MNNSVYRALLDSLNDAGLPYVLLRDDVTGAQKIKDLDLLIDAGTLNQFQALAESQGFFLVKDGVLNPGKKVFLRLSEGTSHILDVHTRVVCRGLEFLDARKLLARRVRENGYYALSQEDELLSLLFHNVLAKREIQQKHAAALRKLLQQSLDENYIARHLAPFGLNRVFANLKGHFEQLADSPQEVAALSRRAGRALRRRRPGNVLRRALVRVRRVTLKAVGKRRGLLVVFLGPDGTGKSTTIRHVAVKLRELGLNTCTAYLGPWGGSMLHLREKLCWLNPDPYREDYKAFYGGKIMSKPGPLRAGKQIKLLLRSALYYSLLMTEMAARWFVRVRPHLLQGKIVLGDRYLYDMLVGYKNRPMDYQIGIRRFLCKLYPRPDICVLLEADPEAVLARKAQLDRQQYLTLRKAYNDMAQKYGFQRLQTGTSPEKTLLDFEAGILPDILRLLHAHLRG